MTVIAGIVEGDTVWVGGDSAAIYGTGLTVRADQKVFRNGEFLFGFCGSFRMGQLLRYAFVPPKHPRRVDIYRYMVTTFVDSARDALKKGGLAQRKNEVEDIPGSFLIGYRGKLFTVEDDYQVAEAVDGFSAVGCGCDLALGALCVSGGIEPRRRLRAALEAAERYSGGVRRPFYILNQGKEP